MLPARLALVRTIRPTYVCNRCVSTLRERIIATRASAKKATATPKRKRRGRLPSARRIDEKAVVEKATTESDAAEATILEKPKETIRRKKDWSKPSKDSIEDAGREIHIFQPSNSDQSAVIDIEPLERVPVPHLAHGLDRVLFNPGVYYLQDPRSHVYNFDPYLQEITPVRDFNFDALTEYITSSRDPTLDELARAHDLKIVGSTSSMTGVLSQFHFFISNWRAVNLKRLSSAFKGKSVKFTGSQRAPAAIYLRHNKGIYAIDADKSLDSGETVLSFLGRSMEKMLTLPPEEFSKLKKDNSAETPIEKSREAYHYSKLGSMLMRSQLDCNDSRLPGTGTFDLKTRAVLPVRMDVKNAHQGAGYQILQSVGLLESFEREYYDMIRAAFLKYSLQVRIGKMDGIFVAYHNTERIFGFQYISLDEMDDAIHGSVDRNIAHREFLMSLKQLDKVLQLAIEKFPDQSMSLVFETTEGKSPSMNVVIEPLTEDEIKRRQTGELLKTLKAAQKNERINKMPSSTVSTNSKGTLEKMSSTLEQMISKNNKKSKSKATVLEERTAPKKEEKEEKEAEEEEKEKEEQAKSEPASTPKIVFRITGKNTINGKVVDGPPVPGVDSTWHFQYSITEMSDTNEVNKMLQGMRDRQVQALTDIFEEEDKPSPFKKDLQRMSDLGRIKLEEQKVKQTGRPVVYRESSSRELEEQYRKSFK